MRLINEMADQKRRIRREFPKISGEADKIVLSGHKCPPEDEIFGRPSICAMSGEQVGDAYAIPIA